ncbi:glycyl-radical enzyme activating protein [uncultured Sunxiuqinia sp.]|uniref:glycyl-radical enzyme activating protein n=1 Tax=uncultured Sunxiuqinia sp. TaxID=1573825 RepID=UPI00260C7A37|nr:glycyl-radical enzyme activating protein [uncultured Sunxiuqinia sp.]
MDGIIFDIKRFAVHDGPGIRTTVFFKGCPLQCQWCHNPESIDPKPVCVPKTVQLNGHLFTENEQVGYTITPRQLLAELQKEQVFMEESGGGVTFSGGEPLLQSPFLQKMLKLCQNHGMHTAVDTSLLASWKTVQQTAQATDLFLLDLKLMDDQKHRAYTGVSNRLILANMQKLARLQKAYNVRIPIIPGVSNTPENIEASIAFLQKLPHPPRAVDLLPFHNTARSKYIRFQLENPFKDQASLRKEALLEIRQQFERAGFTVSIGA